MGRSINDALYWADDGLKKRIVYDGSNNPIYVGKAKPGKATSVAFWQIIKITYVGNNPTQVDFADSDDNFDNIWDNYLSYSYG